MLANNLLPHYVAAHEIIRQRDGARSQILGLSGRYGTSAARVDSQYNAILTGRKMYCAEWRPAIGETILGLMRYINKLHYYSFHYPLSVP